MKVETLIKKGIVKLEMYRSVTEHTNEYGIEAVNPLFIKHLSIEESHRLKGIGNKVIKYLDDYAEKNEHDDDICCLSKICLVNCLHFNILINPL